MTEDKNIDNPSEENSEASAKKNIQEGDTQKESAQKAETQNADASDASAADQSSKQEDPRDEEQSEASVADKNTPNEMQTVEDFDLNLLLDVLANDKLIARGEVVLQNKKYGIRITEITSRMNRIKSLS